MWYPPAVKLATWFAYISSSQSRCTTVFHTWGAGSTRYIATAPECLCLYHRHLHWTDKLVTPLAKNTPLHSPAGRWLQESHTSNLGPKYLWRTASTKQAIQNGRVWPPHAPKSTWFMTEMSPHNQHHWLLTPGGTTYSQQSLKKRTIWAERHLWRSHPYPNQG